MEAEVTLTGQPWRVTYALRLPAKSGKVVERTLTFDANFEIEEGYEPPQVGPHRKQSGNHRAAYFSFLIAL